MHPPIKRLCAQRLGLGLLCLALAACASFSPDGGMQRVTQETQLRLGSNTLLPSADPPAAAKEALNERLTRALSADDAVQIALLNNAGLKADLAELKIAEADLVQAGRLANPGFMFGRLTQGDSVLIERKFTLEVLGLLTLPLRSQLESRRFEGAQLRAAGNIVQLAADTRRAYFEAVAASQNATYLAQAQSAAEASAQLAQRMARVGNFSRLDQMREQVFYAETTSQLARAKQEAIASREHLIRLLGLGEDNEKLRLPERLPDLPANVREPAEVEATALRTRLDVQMANQEIAGLAKSLDLSRATRFINVLDLSYLRNTTHDAPKQTGYEVEVKIPLFDWGGAQLARSEASYMQAVNRSTEIALNARSQARETYLGYRSAYDLARHYRDEIVPLRKKIADEQLLRYNGMLISVFELVADAREQVLSVTGYIDALKNYWIADTALQAALSGAGMQKGKE